MSSFTRVMRSKSSSFLPSIPALCASRRALSLVLEESCERTSSCFVFASDILFWRLSSTFKSACLSFSVFCISSSQSAISSEISKSFPSLISIALRAFSFSCSEREISSFSLFASDSKLTILSRVSFASPESLSISAMISEVFSP